MDSKDGTRDQQDAATIAAPENAGLPLRPEVEPRPPPVSDLTSVPNLVPVSIPSSMDAVSQHGGGRGRRGRGGFRGNHRGGGGHHTQGSYRGTGSSSFSTFSQPHQHCGIRPTGHSAVREDQQAYVPRPHQTGRGRGGLTFGQQSSGRSRPDRGDGRSRGTWSRPSDYPPRPSYDQSLLPQAVLDRVARIETAEPHASWQVQPAEFESITFLQQHMEESAVQLPDLHTVILPIVAHDAGVESLDQPAEVMEQREPVTCETETSSALVKVDRPPSLDSETTENTDATIQSSATQQHDKPIITSVSTQPIHLQDIHFASVPNPIHPAPGQPPETICAWYTYPMPPREGLLFSPLPGPSPGTSTPAALSPHHPLAGPSSHFYFIHDHAYLSLCHPVPVHPSAWLQIPYLAYWGPERLGAHPNFYDVPMFASDA